MAIKIKKLTIWKGEVDNQPGALGTMLGPLAKARADLEVLMGYEKPGESGKSIIEVAPLAGKKAKRVAEEVGLSPSTIPCLLVEGKNRAGLGHRITTALGAAGINMQFLVTLVTGRRYRAIVGFGEATKLGKASKVIRRGAKAKRRR